MPGAERKSGSKRKYPNQLFLFAGMFLYCEIVLRIFARDVVFSHPVYMLLSIAGASLFLMAFTCLGKRKLNRRITTALLAVIAFVYAAQTIVFSVFTTYMAPTNLFSGAGNVARNYMGELLRSIVFGFPKMLIYFLPVILYGVFGRKYLPMRRYKPAFAGAMAVAGIIVTCVLGFAAKRGSQSSMYGAQFDFSRATRTFGLLTSTRLSVKYAVLGNEKGSFVIHATPTPTPAGSGEAVVTPGGESDPQVTAAPTPFGKNQMDLDFSNATDSGVTDLNGYIQSMEGESQNVYTGLFKGKNLILIAAESYCDAFIDPDLTPTLWRLTHNGFYFSDYYQPEWGGSTTTGEVSFLVGIAPRYGDEAMIHLAGHNNYFTMGNQLQRLGYSSAAFHNGYWKYYSRDITHENLGYNQWIANETGIKSLCGNNYPADTTMFEKTVPLYIDKTPFSIYYMTGSGHAPYDGEKVIVKKHWDRVKNAVGNKYPDAVLRYICTQMELEESLAFLVKQLEEKGIADDTVIALVGDHYPYGLRKGEAWGNDRDYINDLIGGDANNIWERDHNGLIIWSGCLEHDNKDMQCEISSPVFSLDILPTLSNLFGVEYDSRLLPGRDVFSDAEPLVFWNELSWITEKGIYDAASETFHPKDGQTVDDEYISRIKSIVENKILLSRTVMDKDYYALLFGKDEVTFAGQKIYDGPNTLPPGYSEES